MAYFQWANYLCDKAAEAGKLPLHVNLDETPVPICFTHLKGNVVRTRQKCAPRQEATRQATRLYFTLVAIICTEPALQPLLPQVLVIGDKALRRQDEAAIRATLPHNVYLLRKRSGWNNTAIQAEIVTLTKTVLQPYLDRYQVLWFSDACKAHMAKEVLGALKEAGFWHCIIPASLTWLLQPLDVLTFVQFKRWLKSESMRKSHGPKVPEALGAMIDTVVHGIRAVFQGTDWRAAFRMVGAMGTQDGVANTLKIELEWDAVPPTSRERPSISVLDLCLPKGYSMDPTDHAACMPPHDMAGAPIANSDLDVQLNLEVPAGTGAAGSAGPVAGCQPGSAAASAALRVGPIPTHRLREKTKSWADPPEAQAASETPP